VQRPEPIGPGGDLVTSNIGVNEQPLTDPTVAEVELLVSAPIGASLGQGASRLPVLICVGWGVGALTTAMMSNIFNLLVLRFATDYLGIAAGMAGLLLAASKLYDAVADPLVGALSDNWHSPRGRRRPFLLLAAILCPLAILALFFVPDLQGRGLLTYYLAALLLFATAYAVWSVPYLAMSAEMTDDYHDRSRLVSYRVNGGAVGLVLSSVGGPWLLVYLGGGRSGHEGMALTMAALILLSSLVCYRMTKGAPFKVRTVRARVPFMHQLRLIAANRPLSLLLLQKSFWYFGFAANQAALAYFIKYVARLSDVWLGAYYMILPLGIIGSQPIWLRISKTLEKKYASMLAMGLFGGLELTWLLSGPEESRVLIVLRLLGLGFGAGGALLLIQSMFNDTIELDYLRTGHRREGIFTGLFSLIEKAFTALGVAALGGFIGMMGYVSSKGHGVVAQPHSAVQAIAVGFAVVPFCTAMISIAVIIFYDLTRKTLSLAGGGA
jgi:GPH family glycoside/pentoside/hexuronide:cation symporter